MFLQNIVKHGKLKLINGKEMILGIIPNFTKSEILKVVDTIVEELLKNNLKFFICDSLLKKKNEFTSEKQSKVFYL